MFKNGKIIILLLYLRPLFERKHAQTTTSLTTLHYANIDIHLQKTHTHCHDVLVKYILRV